MTNKKLYPHLYKYRSLGEMATKEGDEYYMKHSMIISWEHSEEYFVKYHRARLFGGLKKAKNQIHLPYEKHV
jgi:hypothetical protein